VVTLVTSLGVGTTAASRARDRRIYVANADGAPGAAVIGMVLMVIGVVLGVRAARNRLPMWAARTARRGRRCFIECAERRGHDCRAQRRRSDSGVVDTAAVRSVPPWDT
jgi:hypothetical protein